MLSDSFCLTTNSGSFTPELHKAQSFNTSACVQ